MYRPCRASESHFPEWQHDALIEKIREGDKSQTMAWLQQHGNPNVTAVLNHPDFYKKLTFKIRDDLYCAAMLGEESGKKRKHNAELKFISAVDICLQHGMSINQTDSSGRTLLEIADALGLTNTVLFLVKNGASFENFINLIKAKEAKQKADDETAAIIEQMGDIPLEDFDNLTSEQQSAVQKILTQTTMQMMKLVIGCDTEGLDVCEDSSNKESLSLYKQVQDEIESKLPVGTDLSIINNTHRDVITEVIEKYAAVDQKAKSRTVAALRP